MAKVLLSVLFFAQFILIESFAGNSDQNFLILDSEMYEETVLKIQASALDELRSINQLSPQESAKSIAFMSKLTFASLRSSKRGPQFKFHRYSSPIDARFGPFDINAEFTSRPGSKEEFFELSKITYAEGGAFSFRFEAYSQGRISFLALNLFAKDQNGKIYDLQILKPIMIGDSFPAVYSFGSLRDDADVFDGKKTFVVVDDLGRVNLPQVSSLEKIIEMLQSRKLEILNSQGEVENLKIISIAPSIRDEFEVELDFFKMAYSK